MLTKSPYVGVRSVSKPSVTTGIMRKMYSLDELLITEYSELECSVRMATARKSPLSLSKGIPLKHTKVPSII